MPGGGLMLILARHGRTPANAAGLLQGRADHPLDAVGERQAEALGRMLLGVTENATVVSSPLLRARQTAARIAAAAGRVDDDIVIDERWVELDYGTMDGVPTRDVPAATWAAWRADPEFCPPGGESLSVLDLRVRSACESLRDNARRGDVVIVSHVSPIKAAVAWALGGDVFTSWRLQLGQASVSRIGVGPNGPALVVFNDTSHLNFSEEPA